MSSRELVIGIDIGTSQAKGGVFDPQGRCLGKASFSYTIHSPHSSWDEVDAEDWWQAVCHIIHQSLARARVSGRDIAAISVSSLLPCCLPVDHQGNPLRRAIIWRDRRTDQECAWMEQHIGSDACFEISGNRIDHYFWGPKVLWIKHQEPKIFKRTWKLLQAHSYMVLKLCGETVTDFTCGNLSIPFYDYRKRCWSPVMSEKMGVPIEMLPDLVPSHKVVGRVSTKVTGETGLDRGTLVVTGCGDFASSTLGAGVYRQGEACMMLGTAGNLLIPMDNPNFDPRLINSSHALPNRYISFATSYAGGSLQWLRQVLAGSRNEFDISYQQLDLEASRIPLGSEGLLFLPFLPGELTINWDRTSRGVFFGLTLNHTRGHLYRAVLESIGYRYRHMLEIMASHGVTVTEATLINGGGRSPVWRQILADITGMRLRYTESEGAPLGNAVLAAMGAKLIKSGEEVKNWLSIKSETEPDQRAYRLYNDYFQLYKRLYEHLKDDFQERYRFVSS